MMLCHQHAIYKTRSGQRRIRFRVIIPRKTDVSKLQVIGFTFLGEQTISSTLPRSPFCTGHQKHIKGLIRSDLDYVISGDCEIKLINSNKIQFKLGD